MARGFIDCMHDAANAPVRAQHKMSPINRSVNEDLGDHFRFFDIRIVAVVQAEAINAT
jgi:hypothetical protein